MTFNQAEFFMLDDWLRCVLEAFELYWMNFELSDILDDF